MSYYTNAMMRHTILTTFALVASLLLLSGCHQSLSSIDPLADPDCAGRMEQRVHISARVATYSPSDGTSTRATEDGTPVPGEKEWYEKQKAAETEESAVYCVVLAAYKYDEASGTYATQPTKLAFYHSPALMYAYRISEGGDYTGSDGSTAGDVKLHRELRELEELHLGKERKEVRSFATGGFGELTMDLDLLPGKYLFLLVANSWSATKQALAVMDGEPGATFDPEHILGPEDRTEPFTTLDLIPNFFLHIPHRMMPMVGQRVLEVPESGGQLTPDITLERVYARLDLTLTTASKDASGELHYLTSDRDGVPYTPEDYLLTDLTLYNLGRYTYALLPQQEERSALDDRILEGQPITVPTGERDKPYLFGYDDLMAERYRLDKSVPVAERNLLAKSKYHFSHYFIHEVPFKKESKNPFYKPDPSNPIRLDKLYQRGLLYYFSNELRDVTTGRYTESGIYTLTFNEEWYLNYYRPLKDAGKWSDLKDQRPSHYEEMTLESLLKQFGVHIYLPPLYQTGEGGREMSFSLTFTKAKDPTDTRTYRLRLANKDTDKDRYAIRRNTIYRYDLTFYGASLEYNMGYEVPTWTDKEVDLPW